MKRLIESILDIDDLSDTVKKSAIETIMKSISSDTRLDMSIDGTILNVTGKSKYPIIYKLDSSVINSLGITRIHFNDCKPIFFDQLSNLTISSNIGIDFARSVASGSSHDITFEAPVVRFTYHIDYKAFKNIKIISDFIIFCCDPTPGIKKLSRAGFGKFTKTKFTVTDCDQQTVDEIVKTIALKYILPPGVTVQTPYISIIVDAYIRIRGGYLIVDPANKNRLQNKGCSSGPIGTLKDGWLITQTQEDADYLQKIFK